MIEANLTGSLLEKDVRRAEAERQSEVQSKPLKEVIEDARVEIAGAFSKKKERVEVFAR